MANIDELMAAMNQRQITDDEGQISDEGTSESETVADESSMEETSEEDIATGENPSDELEDETRSDQEDSEKPALDESGKRYIPENRFKEVYAEKKALERELESLKSVQTPKSVPQPIQPTNVDKADLLETEFLHKEYPQFNPGSGNYSRLLDEMGAEIYRTNPGISKLEAARRALDRAAQLTKQVSATKEDAKIVKQQYADSGMATRASRSVSEKIDLDKMSDRDLEAYLKSTGNW